MASKKTQYTEEEIIGLLKHSHNPVILVEGPDDVMLYRQIENHLNMGGAVYPCGGRNTLLSIYKRRNEYPKCKVCYIADRDLYYFDGIPSEYQGIVFTTGYSIENDIIAGSNVFNYYASENESIKEVYRQIREQSSIWWAFQIQEHKCENTPQYATHIKDIIIDIPRNTNLDYEVFDRHNQVFQEPPEDLVANIRENFELAIRGHLLEQIHQTLLSCFEIKHCQNRELCLDLATLSPSRYFIQICNSVENQLNSELHSN